MNIYGTNSNYGASPNMSRESRYNARKEMERVKSDVVSPYQAILNQLQNQQSA